MRKEQVEQGLRAMGIPPRGFTGEWVQASCPFPEKHGGGRDKNPSFGVSVGPASFFNCFTCHSKGRFQDLPQLIEMDSNQRAKLLEEFQLAEAVGVEIDPESYEAFSEEIPALPEQVYGDLFPPVRDVPAALAYCESRDISADTCDRLGLGAWPEETRIMFPVRGFDGQLYGFQGRAYTDGQKPKTWNTEGLQKSCHLMGAEHADLTKPNVLVEGLFAYAAFHEFDIPNVMDVNVLAILGSELSVEQADMLVQLNKPVCFFLDGDKAGRTGVWGDDKKEGGIHMLSRAGLPVSCVEYPHRVSDPDLLSVEQIEEMIANAKRYVRPRSRR